ncbi:MAG: DUF1801 domain-containing protein [Rhizobacter sp.]|nr:DUF1801 domain-containing protein [Ferruginibacter sp.]
MKKTGPTTVPATIDAYLEQVPETPRQTLEKVRKAIRSAAPKATELISYQIPTFKQEYALVAFAAFKNHCSIFTLSNTVMKTLAEELEPYDCKGVTIHFPLDKPIPATLIKKIVQLRLVEDTTRAIARDSKKKK